MASFGFIVGEFGKGGQETQLKYLIQALKKDGHDASLIVWSYHPNKKVYADEYTQEIHANLLLLNNQSLKEKIILSRKFIGEHNVATLQSFAFYLNFFCWLICLGKKSIAIGGIRSRIHLMKSNTGLPKFWLSSFFPRAKISNNKYFKKGSENILINLAYANTQIVTNQIDMSLYPPRPLPNNPIIQTASVSRLHPVKDIPLLLNALAELKSSGVKFKHSHAGDGSLADVLHEKMRELGLSDYFDFVGEKDDIQKFLEDKDLFILTSLDEGYPNVVMEAFACGKPVISTNCGDVSTIIDQGKNGYIVHSREPKEIADILLSLIKRPEKVKELAAEAYRKAKMIYQLNLLAKNTIAVYNKLGLKINQ